MTGLFGFWRFGLGETAESGSTKCDCRSILVAKAQRRRLEGLRVRKASALEDNPPSPMNKQLIFKFEFSRVRIVAWNLKRAAQDKS